MFISYRKLFNPVRLKSRCLTVSDDVIRVLSFILVKCYFIIVSCFYLLIAYGVCNLFIDGALLVKPKTLKSGCPIFGSLKRNILFVRIITIISRHLNRKLFRS